MVLYRAGRPRSFSLFLNAAGKIFHSKAFSHFVYENGELIVAAAFLDGHIEYGDAPVGADGKNSKVRDLIFGKVNFTPRQSDRK
jgi:2-polyprenyl-6-methoxyphenol hydroxylase-like FAD-dependent oxidoreductase